MSERAGNPEIYSMKSDGSAVVRLTNNAALGGTGEDTAPSWHIGSEILFSSKRSGVVSAIYAMKSDGSGVRELTPAVPFSDNAACPSWTTDGQRFVYHADSGFGPPDLFMRDASGGNLTSLLTHDASDLCPRWAPRRQGVYLTAAGVVIPNAAVGTPLPKDEVLVRVKAAMVGVDAGTRTGAGFVIAPGNLVLTANHVIAGAGMVNVRLPDGTSRTATVVGRDLVRDLALLTLGPSVSFPALGFDEAGRLRAGDLLIAGGSVTTTETLFTALDVDDARNLTWVRTNGTFTTGLDGGPLVGPRGEVMGVISLRHATTEAGGAGMAIAANTVLNYLDRLKAGGVIVK
jgi:hypothetical protein